jgi:autotransporter translocation and assembly factor TamB
MQEARHTPALRIVRRLLQGAAFLGTLIVAAVAVALIVSQTPWFRDWLRRYVVRESRQYLNGELTIGGLGGNLFFGVRLDDVAVDISGTRAIAVKGLEIDYNVFQIVSRGIVLDRITLVEPRVRLERDGEGWNLGQLVKSRRREADREGPARHVTLHAIRISDGAVEVDDREGSKGLRLPERIADLDVRAAFAYEPVHSTIDLEHVSFRTEAPQLALRQLAGRVAVRDDDLYLEKVVLKTPESSLSVDGVIQDYPGTPVLKLTGTGRLSLPEIGRIVPAAAVYTLTPVFEIRASGAADTLALDFDVRSEAGRVGGQVTADVRAPDLGVKGRVLVERLDLAPILRNPSQRSDLSGRADLDVRMVSAPADVPALDRMSGTFRFSGPRAMAAGYTATNVRADGRFENGRIVLDASADAYGGSATASGFVRPAAAGRPLAFELRGRADALDLRNLPAFTGVPALETNLSVSSYEVRGEGPRTSGTVALGASTVEGASIGEGTTAAFANDRGTISYGAKGSVADLNVPRIGRALKLEALDRPSYDGQITGTFDVNGAGTTIETLTLDASGRLTTATIMGGRLDNLTFDTRIRNRGLDATVKGDFTDVDPAVAAARPALEGRVSGSVDARVQVADLTRPITPDSIAATGSVQLAESRMGDLQIDGATLQGEYANSVGDITKLELRSPDATVTASGRLALDRSSQSALTYHVTASDLATLAALAGQKDVGGSVVLDGRVSGNAASLTTTGTLDGSNVSYGANSALDLDSTYTVTLPEMDAAAATVEAKTTAEFVKAAGMELTQVTAATTCARKRLDFAAKLQEQTRELDARGQVIFHPDHQEVHLPELAIRTEGIEWRMAGGADPAIQYGSNRVTFQNVRLVNGEQSLDVGGELPLGGENTGGALAVTAANVDLSQLERLLMRDQGMSGRLSANATISGTAKRPVVDGHAEIRDGGFRGYKYESLVADVDYNGSRIDLDAVLQQSPTEAFTARGTLPMTVFARGEGGHVEAAGEDRLDLTIESTDLGLGFVQGFTSAVENVTGTLQANIRLTGSGRDPHVEGYVDIRNGAFGVPLGGVTYKGLDTRIELVRDFVTIRSFDIVDEEGARMSVSGRLAVHERKVGEVDVSFASKNFEVIDNELGDVGLDTNLRITGELRRPRVEGEVRTATGRLELDRILQLFYDPYSVESLPPVASAERTVEGTGSAEEATRQALSRAHQPAAREEGAPAAEAAAAPAGGAFAPVAIDVHLVIPDNLVIRGNDLRPGGPTSAAIGDMNITVGGDLYIRKKADGPLGLVGTVNTVRGRYEFQRRRFDLVRGGTLRFTGDAEINPLVDVAAVRQIPDTGVEARINITGTARAPQLQLSSTPPLEESDILAMIIFNRQVNELGTGERASLAATAGGIATGFIAAPLGESIGRALDLDLFEITTTTEGGELGAGLTVGQQVGDRAFVKLRQQFGRQNVSEFLIEYQLANFLRLQATASPETVGSANRLGQRRVERAGIDLIFFFSY